MAPDNTMNTHRAERILLVVGLVFVCVWTAAQLHRSISSRAAISRFHATVVANSAQDSPVTADPVLGSKVDVRLWSPKRIAAYEGSLVQKTDAPLAILRIQKINLEVPVFNDTDELTLNRGVGRIQGTAQAGQTGNLGIAGHRDGFFRGLKDVGPGDILELELPGRTDHYIVNQIQIVTPGDTFVLKPTPAPTLTLVTCYPFYYVGSAPQRYIVTASIQNSGRRD
jgi:sortase A